VEKGTSGRLLVGGLTEVVASRYIQFRKFSYYYLCVIYLQSLFIGVVYVVFLNSVH
jgi:hypothetical protein